MIIRRNVKIVFAIVSLVMITVLLMAVSFYNIHREDIILVRNFLEEINFTWKKISLRRLNSLKIQGITLMDREKIVGVGIKEALVNFEGLSLFSKKKSANVVFDFDNIKAILNPDNSLKKENSVFRRYIDSFLAIALHDDLLSVVVDSGQEYNFVFELLFLEGSFIKIKDLKAISKDVHFDGTYEYYYERDVVQVEVSVAFSPEITTKYPDLIDQYRLAEDENGWYGFVYEVKGPASFIRGMSSLFMDNK